jgi:hypothetical protein
LRDPPNKTYKPKMKKNEFNGKRISVILGPLGTIFFLYIFFTFSLPDFLTKKSQLKNDSGYIELITKTTTDRKNNTHLNIYVKEKDYFIQLSDKSRSKYWNEINRRENLNKYISYKFQKRLLFDGILHNPNEIAIGNREIITFESSKSISFWVFIGTVVGICLVSYLSYYTIEKYRKILYPLDQKLWKESKWKVIWLWLSD